MHDVHGYSVVTWDVCVRDWLCETKLGRWLLSCEARPSMESRYWLSCVRRGGPWCTSLGYRTPIGCILTGALPRIWRDGEAICLTELYLDSKGRESRLGTVGCVVRLACLALWVVSLSCLWPQWCKAYVLSFIRVLSTTKVGVVGYLLSGIVDKLSICVL